MNFVELSEGPNNDYNPYHQLALKSGELYVCCAHCLARSPGRQLVFPPGTFQLKVTESPNKLKQEIMSYYK